MNTIAASTYSTKDGWAVMSMADWADFIMGVVKQCQKVPNREGAVDPSAGSAILSLISSKMEAADEGFAFGRDDHARLDATATAHLLRSFGFAWAAWKVQNLGGKPCRHVVPQEVEDWEILANQGAKNSAGQKLGDYLAGDECGRFLLR